MKGMYVKMCKYKMICLDIDGTLLNSHHKITRNTKKIIQRVTNSKQIILILVSARMPQAIYFLLKELDIVQQPIICYNGALIVDEKKNFLLQKYISISNVRQINSYAETIGLHISLYKDDEWYIDEMDEWVRQESEITNVDPIIRDYNDLFNIWEKENLGPNKILCMAQQQKIESLYTKIKESALINNLNIYPSKFTYLEIMPINASKNFAIDLLCKRFNVKKSEVIAIGDNFNDIDMIKYAGLGIAMGNAPEQVKHFADYVTLTNDEDGVAEAIKKFVL
ncbi:Cof-type HAD-IIB family hydrolase [Thermoanaerobacterium thermosaccharolyticum]|uniref:Cof-type HAD-IIB family hydrolase n=1 Tax=Thermoanaerobacterium thermosaccharolyticum TaxID=1517 RepID=UPI003DA7A93F